MTVQGTDSPRSSKTLVIPIFLPINPAMFFPSGAFFCHGTPSFAASAAWMVQTLISTSTPAGNSSFISESTVLFVELRISISRLWARVSNCSLDFLST